MYRGIKAILQLAHLLNELMVYDTVPLRITAFDTLALNWYTVHLATYVVWRHVRR